MRTKYLAPALVLAVGVVMALPSAALASHSDPVLVYDQFQKNTVVGLPSEGTTISTISTSGFTKTLDAHGGLLSTGAAPAEFTGSGSNPNFNCLYDRERTGFAALPIKDYSASNSDYVYQFLFYPYRQRNARTINGVSQLQWLICGNGGADGQNGNRFLHVGPGVAYRSSTTRKIGQNWKSGSTPSSTTISLGFQVGTGPVTVTGSISQTPTNVLKGGTVGPSYDSEIDPYSNNAAVGWWDTNCGFLCTRYSGSSDFQGSVVEALWEMPMPSTNTTYSFTLARYGQYHCSNVVGSC